MQTENEKLWIHRREYGRHTETREIDAANFPSFENNGWVRICDPLPEPRGEPDIEVLELIIKDRESELKAAEDEASAKNIAVVAAYKALDAAKNLMKKEDAVKSEIKREDGRRRLRDACRALMQKAHPDAVPARHLIALAESEHESRFIRDEICDFQNYVGKDDAGDDLFALDKAEYLRRQQRRQIELEAEKEAAIRARMK